VSTCGGAYPAETVLRPAAQSNYSALCDLFRELDGLHAEALPDVFVPYQGPPRTADFAKQSREGKDSTIIEAEVACKPVGLVTARIQISPPLQMFARSWFAVLDSLIVAAAHRRKGIGTALAREAHKWALCNGVERAWLNVWEFNESAISFYESLGYQTIGRRMQVDLG